jgi:uncharacterized protein YkwD
MKKRAIIFVLATLPLAIFSQSPGSSQKGDFEWYRSLNEQETRLSDFKDTDEALSLKLVQLAVINESRKKHGAGPVKLDILASRVANKQCREAAENGFVSHWNLSGEKPYHRYAFAGGLDHVSENAYGEWTSGGKYEISSAVIAQMMKEGHGRFMKEKAPYDGHKKTIIDKAHNYIGIGFHLTKSHFSYYEEFINRGLEFSDIPVRMKVNEAGSITVYTKGKSYLYYLMIYREDFPQPRKLSQLKNTGSYQDYTDEVYKHIPAWDLAKYKSDFVYTIPVRFTKEGLYYILIYTDKKENTGQSAISTKGKPPLSGIVISVKN